MKKTYSFRDNIFLHNEKALLIPKIYIFKHLLHIVISNELVQLPDFGDSGALVLSRNLDHQLAWIRTIHLDLQLEQAQLFLNLLHELPLPLPQF